ncbi:MAG: glucosaminidase domain-containing protein [Alphaproteobacteria bacterium]
MTAAHGMAPRAGSSPCAWPACAAIAGLALLAMAVARDGARDEAGEALLGWSVAAAAVPAATHLAPDDMVAAPAPAGDLLAALPSAPDEPGPAPADAPRAAPAPGRLPAALVDAAPGEARKRLFLDAMMPALVAENERLLERRARILATYDAIDAGGGPADEDLAWLAEIAERHAADPADRAGLLARVDAIPLSLGIAQAALESGWGASRGAQEWHGIFGQMSFAPDPGRPVLRRFDGIQEAVAAWALNLNGHRAYARFRAARAKAREEGRAPEGHALAGELLRYSERGEAYVRELRALIRANGFEALDRQDERG